ncbi:branched-chain amino acid ABC transporter permease [Limibaculum sp. M0105]|uniref:Branched-chain amino acid ABC transporter permease n=1 Tax=Thermohalobaculum xanthum TaxID=2753746 RepID=A0A8J7MA86_9RHOB|nr:branched-chain amino acid ABC transporter permease [Thermohalobaculum xanthum]MBK0401078.1 branched-chain amino acid ABC transporter permease [Thermohalobaculum xanthum]
MAALRANWFYLAVLIGLLILPAYAESEFVTAVMPRGLSGSALLHIFVLIFFFAFMSQAWNIIGGFAGQLSIGHAAFFGIGAYVSTICYVHLGLTPWLGMFVAAVFTALVGAGLGLISFHYGLKGPFFALVTVAFAEITRLILLHWEFVGAANGILLPFSPNPTFWEFQFTSKEPYYYIALAMMLASIALVAWIARSRFGYYLHAIRQDEDAAEAVGVPTKRCKVQAIALSAALAGLGGTFYAQYTQYIVPDDMVVGRVSVEILLGAVIGGAGTVMGPIVGAFILIPVGEATRVIFEGGGTGTSLSTLIAADMSFGDKFVAYLDYLAAGGGGGLAIILYGCLLMVVVLGMPGGVLPWLAGLRARARRRAEASA